MRWNQAYQKGMEPIEFLKNLGGYIDRYHMLQWKDGGEYQDQPPHSSLYHWFADAVAEKYGEKGLAEFGEEGRMIHLFRMYIDEQNILYVRRHFRKAGMTDEEALSAYVETAKEQGGLGGEKLLREPARYHNKYPKGSSYRRYQKGKENKKRLTPDFHSEFILDRSGCFVSQWNILERNRNGLVISNPAYYRHSEDVQRQIMDTESFNYASANDALHKRLDIQPPKTLDTDLRRLVLKGWKRPSKRAYDYASDKGDGYSRSNS